MHDADYQTTFNNISQHITVSNLSTITVSLTLHNTLAVSVSGPNVVSLTVMTACLYLL